MTLRTAIDAGVRYIDTAPWYGQGESETMLGRFLPHYPREDFVIATKVGRYEKSAKEMFDFSAGFGRIFLYLKKLFSKFFVKFS